MIVRVQPSSVASETWFPLIARMRDRSPPGAAALEAEPLPLPSAGLVRVLAVVLLRAPPDRREASADAPAASDGPDPGRGPPTAIATDAATRHGDDEPDHAQRVAPRRRGAARGRVG